MGPWFPFIPFKPLWQSILFCFGVVPWFFISPASKRKKIRRKFNLAIHGSHNFLSISDFWVPFDTKVKGPFNTSHLAQFISQIREEVFELHILKERKLLQARSHQWTTRPAHRPGRQWLSLEFEILGQTDGGTEGRMYRRTDNLCENSDHYRSRLWSVSWINILCAYFLLSYRHLQPNVMSCLFNLH